MCGLFGAIAGPGAALDLTAFERATQVIRSRGPDDEGYALIDPIEGRALAFAGSESQPGQEYPPIAEAPRSGFPLAFGFRRLSILDLSTAGHQPMSRDDGRLWMVFNGEIYNYVELAKQLGEAGYAFKSSSDSEVLLAAYQHWGVDCFTRLVGMWAAAIWDGRRRQLVLSRDPFGIKPLYFAFRNGGLVFGSELKSFIAFSNERPVVDPQSLYNYLRIGRPGFDDRSLVRGVSQISPGHFATIDLDKQGKALQADALRMSAFWRAEDIGSERISYSSAVEKVRETFLTNIRQHLRSDVPVAVSLSGGIDSSAVLMCTRKVLGPDVPINVFSFIASEKFLSEESWIDLVAGRAKAKIHKVSPTPDDMRRDIEDLASVQDEPIGSMSPYAQYRVFKLARDNGIKVTLDGQGADEYLAGYRRYRWMRLASNLRKREIWDGLRFALAAGRQDPMRVLGLVNAAAKVAWPPGGAGDRLPLKMPLGASKDYFDSHEIETQQQFVAHTDDVLKENLIWTLARESLPELLRFADRNSMAFSIESRVPFLTTPLVEMVLSMPESYILSNDATSKCVFRAAMRGIVPDEVLDRRDKIGFTVPELHWLKHSADWVMSVLDEDRTEHVGPLLSQIVRQEWLATLSGTKGYNPMIWRWLNLVLWSERHQAIFD